jgi:diguanylate cyclase (GGDEF)-like protein
MKHVILIGESGESARGLVESLRGAGFVATRAHENWVGSSRSLFAVLLRIDAGAEFAAVCDDARRASARWPGVPLVAFHRADAEEGPARLDDAALARLGFRAVAEDPAQLPALLRDIESSGHDAPAPDTHGVGEAARGIEDACPSILLPERLGVRSLRAAFEMVASLHFSNDQRGAASTALVGLASLVAADRWTIYLAAETGVGDTQLLEPLAARGLTQSERGVPEGDWRRAVAGDALTLAGAESEAAREAVGSGESSRASTGGREVLALPLMGGERVMGVVEAVREGKGAVPFSAGDESLLAALSLPLAAALSNSVRIAEAERLSQTDDLTKLHNARFLRQYLTGEVKRARRYNSQVSAMFLDLDDFKAVNDQHGHLAGSHVLMEVAAVILSSVRDTDVVARYGGDEFVVVLPETGEEPAARVAERVRERISAHTFTGGRSLRLRLTASFGVACFPAHASSPQQLVAAADAAMYDAKAARKNCVRFAEEAAS